MEERPLASPLVEAHVEAQARLRLSTARVATAVWDALPDHDESSVGLFVDTTVPIVEAGQRRAVQLLDGYCARVSERPALGLDPGGLVGSASRNGTDLEEVYRRPFVQLWSELKAGRPWEDAVAGARARLETAVQTDMLRAQMLAAARVVELDPETNSMERALRGTCEKCIEAQKNGGTVMVEIHPGCQCSVVPSARPPTARQLPQAYVIARARAAGKTWEEVAEEFGLPSRRQINRMRQSLLDEGFDSYGKRVSGEKSFGEKVAEGMARSKAKRAEAETGETLEEVGRRLPQTRYASNIDRYKAEKPAGVEVEGKIGWYSRDHLNDYYRMPEQLRYALDKEAEAAGGPKVRISDNKLPDMKGAEDLKGQQPRGWREGSVWDDVGGAYRPSNDVAYASSGRSGSEATVIHEIGHLIESHLTRNYYDYNPNFLREWRHWHEDFFDRMIPYLQQGGRGGRAGMQEFFAESTAELFTLSERTFNLRWSKEYREWLLKQIGYYAGGEL